MHGTINIKFWFVNCPKVFDTLRAATVCVKNVGEDSCTSNASIVWEINMLEPLLTLTLLPSFPSQGSDIFVALRNVIMPSFVLPNIISIIWNGHIVVCYMWTVVHLDAIWVLNYVHPNGLPEGTSCICETPARLNFREQVCKLCNL